MVEPPALPSSERWLYRTHRGGVVHLLAAAAGSGWTLVAAARRRAYALGLLARQEASVPVVSVGSPVVGGAGKTEVAWWCACALAEERAGCVAIASRGYGRAHAEQLVVWAGGDVPAPSELGDEAWMLAQRARERGRNDLVVAVGRRRVDAIRAAQRQRPDLFAAVLDDGLQHLALRRALDVVVVPAEVERYGVLPAGPLREPLQRCLDTAGLVWVHGGDGRLGAEVPEVCGRPAEVWSRYALVGLVPAAPTGSEAPVVERCLLFSGIGRNAFARRLLEDHGVAVEQHVAVRDHGAFSPELLARCRASELPWVTTAKDWPRLEQALSAASLLGVVPVYVARIALQVLGGEALARERLRGVRC